MSREDADVRPPLPEWGKLDREDAQSVVEILAEAPRLDVAF
jgi:hypothetical protein